MSLTIYPAANAGAALVLAHGAGAGQKSAWMVNAAQAIAGRGISCATFDFPYITAGRKVPDKAPVLEAHWRTMLDEARGTFEGLPLFIGGKSMGGRIASQATVQHGATRATVQHGTTRHPVQHGATRDPVQYGATDAIAGVSGLLFFGYPLHPPGRPEQRRDAHLPAITLPMLFIQGSDDTFGNEREMTELMPRLQNATLHVIAGGDHSLKVRGGAKVVEAAFDEAISTAVHWMVSKANNRKGR